MKAILLFSILMPMVSCIQVWGQSDTAHHRAVYAEINDKEKSFKKVLGTHKDEPLIFDLTGWMDGSEVRKIVSKSNEDGEGFEEYYLENEKPLFVYSTYQKNHLSKKPVRIENRLYFRDGNIFKWLTNDSSAGVLHSEDYASESERLNSNCADFVAALKGGSSMKGKGEQVIEGSFLGIEEGDYFHWNMRDATGRERSFFILNPDSTVDKVIANPEAFVGKKCRISWQRSEETIPEAGGKMQVEQILRVEWLLK